MIDGRDLFGNSAPRRRETSPVQSVFQTPSWACESIVERYYADLSSTDVVLEPSCGEGHFLDAIPKDVTAIGVEMDPGRATIAHQRTGREVIVGDVLELTLGVAPTVIIGNPPFEATFVDRLLERAYQWLPDEGRCGLILPAFVMSTSSRVMRESRRWSISADMIPREMFPHLRMPVIFARFEKRRDRVLVGFALFPDMWAIRALPKRIRFMLENGRSPAWRAVVFDALRELGGEATLERLYETIEGRRPTENPHWRAKIRQVVHHYAERTAPCTYRLPSA